MESLLFMQMTLPHCHGGYGLGGVVLNKEIRLKEKGTTQKTNKVFADLYWDKAKLIVEYDSFEHHNNEDSWMKDAQRLTTLERNGYRVLSVNTAQLYNEKAFHEFAMVVARCLGKPLRIRTPRFEERRSMLRSLLPRRTDAALNA
jgi:hypothetical protein